MGCHCGSEISATDQRKSAFRDPRPTSTSSRSASAGNSDWLCAELAAREVVPCGLSLESGDTSAPLQMGACVTLDVPSDALSGWATLVKPASQNLQDEPNSCDGETSGASTHPGSDSDATALEDGPPENLPNFSGEWRLVRIEGDFETVMADAGCSWALRKAAKTANYGIGLVVHSICHNGSSFGIEIWQPGSTVQIHTTIDGVEYCTTGEDGKQSWLTMRWDGLRLKTASRMASGALGQTSWRVLEGAFLIIETVTPNGTVVKRYFAKD